MELELHGDNETGFYWVDVTGDGTLLVSCLYDTIDVAQKAREDQSIDWA